MENLRQALHNSHSTLDRTCSDSVVSLKHRKSTSDLTNEEHRKENENVSSTAPTKHRRRGSSKGGLAYLVEKRDSRRGSGESVMSTMSQQTNVSNEDIGPLTSFQQTQRGRQRRTSNFLELPGELLQLIRNVCATNYLN
jgi:Rad and Gem related GTP binding protein 1